MQCTCSKASYLHIQQYPFLTVAAGHSGEYECRFTVDTQSKMITKTYIKMREPSKPEGNEIMFSPSKEQYTDGDKVTLTCSVSANSLDLLLLCGV